MGSVSVAPRREIKVILGSALRHTAAPLVWAASLAILAAIIIFIFRFGWLP